MAIPYNMNSNIACCKFSIVVRALHFISNYLLYIKCRKIIRFKEQRMGNGAHKNMPHCNIISSCQLGRALEKIKTSTRHKKKAYFRTF